MKNFAPKSDSLGKCLIKISVKKNENSIHSELTKVAMLPKNVV